MIKAKKEIDIKTAERPDGPYTASLINTLFSQRVAIIGVIIICLFIIGLLFTVVNKPPIITVIDSSTGQTFCSQNIKINDNIIALQLKYYSKKFCEDYTDLDFITSKNSRVKALNMMIPNIKYKYSEIKDNDEVNKAIKNKYSCSYNWINLPMIVKDGNNIYSVACQFEREVKKQGFKPLKKKFCLRIDWIRRVKVTREEIYKRPTSLYVVDIKNIDLESAEYKEIMKKIYN